MLDNGKPEVTILNQDAALAQSLERALVANGHRVTTLRLEHELEALFLRYVPDVLVVDIDAPELKSTELITRLRNSYPDLGIIILASDQQDDLRDSIIQAGADNFYEKPISPFDLIDCIKTLILPVNKRDDVINLKKAYDHRPKVTPFEKIITKAQCMSTVLKLVEKVSARDLSVLIWGESGTGKELCAQAIHQNSTRKNGNFVPLNCAALPESLVESELFGHERGSFTGAVNARIGKIQEASGGTLFLDEIGELPLAIQPKLLRALQEKTIVPVGGKTTVNCDFRLVCATNRDLVEEVKAGRFREDLFYRVAVFPIKLPTLRERREDLELLLGFCLQQEGMREPRIEKDALLRLTQYHWPGNIREVRNFCQAIPLYIEGELITLPAVVEYFGSRLESIGNQQFETTGRGNYSQSLTSGEPNRPVINLDDLQREEIIYALKYYKGNVAEAARALGMGRATLYKYINKNKIEIPI